jgi:hypothetical protein
VCDTDSVFILFISFVLFFLQELYFVAVLRNVITRKNIVIFFEISFLAFFKNENLSFIFYFFLNFPLGQEDDADKEDNDLGGSSSPVPIVAASTVAVNFDKSLISEGEGGG